MKILVPRSITEAQMLEDLNGVSRPPFGLRHAFREHYQFDLGLAQNGTIVTDLYIREFREVVDLWLGDRTNVDQRRRVEKEIDGIESEFLIARSELQQLEDGHKRRLEAPKTERLAPPRQNVHRTERCAREYRSLQETRVTPLEKQLKVKRKEYTRLNAQARRYNVHVSRIMGYIAEGVKILPGRSHNGDFAFVLTPTRAVPESPWTPSPPPSSAVDPDQFPKLEDYAAALVKEKFAAIPLVEPVAPPETDEVSDEEIDKTNGWMIRKAAWFAFAQIITGNRKARIAKCVNPHCAAPYFRLGKVNTDRKATRCRICRREVMDDHRRKRVEDERGDAEKAVLQFVAKSFRAKIKRDPVGWYRDRRIQEEIAAAVTHFIRASGPAVKNRYRGGVTSRWIVAGRSGGKNWSKVLHALDADA